MNFSFKLLLVFLFVYLKLSASTIDLTKEEKQWLKDNPHIKFSIPKNHPPFSMLDKQGKIIGISPEIFQLLSEKIGQKIELVPTDFSNTHKMAKEKGFYGVYALFKIPQNEKEYIFTKEFFSTPFLVFAHKSNTDKITNKNDLKGKKVVIVKSQRAIKKYLEKIKDVQIIIVDTPKKQMQMVLSKEADALIGYVSYQYMINKYLMSDLTLSYISEKEFQVYLGINPQYKMLQSILNKAIDSISKKQMNLIMEKWNTTPASSFLNLSKDEKLWLERHNKIRVGSNKDFFPFEAINKEKNFQGISIDYLDLIQKRLDINFISSPNKPWEKILQMAKEKKLDLLTAFVPTKKREENFYFTKPYISHPMMIITSEKTPFIDGIEGLKNKKIALEKGYFCYELIKSKYPNLNLELYNSSLLALKAVSMGRADAYIGNIAMVDYLSQQNGITNLKISGETPFRLELAFAVNKDLKEFIPILQKALDSITQEEKNKIYQKWISIKPKAVIDYTLFWKSIVIFILILAIILYWNQKLKKEIIQRKKIEKDLEELNKTLEQKVQEQVNKNKTQQAIMFHQSRLAQMGEMLSMIAHQWRQPLNNVSAIIQTISLKYKKNKLDPQIMEKFNQEALKQIKYMSQTIDDFRDFFKPRGQQEEFEICKIIERSVCLIQPIKNIDINLQINCEENISIFGYKNELGQAILNILNNSKDAFEQSFETNKWIKIDIIKKEKQVILKIEDNAKGIKKENLEKVFDPYFSTKLDKNGTGLGLYMTKIIIEEYMKGTIELENTTYGLLISIIIPTEV